MQLHTLDRMMARCSRVSQATGEEIEEGVEVLLLSSKSVSGEDKNGLRPS